MVFKRISPRETLAPPHTPPEKKGVNKPLYITVKVAIICPVHPPKFDYLDKCLQSFYTHNLNLYADFWIVFSNEQDQNAFCGYERFLIVPPEIDTKSNHAINRKKLYAVNKLSEMGYEYLITIDADFLFINTVDLYNICERYFDEKKIIGNFVSSSLFVRIDQCCISHFRGDERSARIPTNIYTWLNQPCIYKGDTIKDFFEKLDYKNDFNMYFWDDFDYILYTYYLILHRGFELLEMVGWDNRSFGESTEIPKGYDLKSLDDFSLLISRGELLNKIRMVRPDFQTIIITHTDRK